MDACVLIDFIKTDRAVLELVVKHLGPLHVISPIVDEVNDIDDENELIALGLIIIEPEIEVTAGFARFTITTVAASPGSGRVDGINDLHEIVCAEGVHHFGRRLGHRTAEPNGYRKLALHDIGFAVTELVPSFEESVHDGIERGEAVYAP